MKPIGNAVFSNGGAHRYLLSRLWNDHLPIVGFGLLNPSKAGAHVSDNTVSGCIRMAVELGFGGLVVVNAYSYMGTIPMRPSRVRALDLTGGEANIAAWAFALGFVSQMILAWGNGVERPHAEFLFAQCVAWEVPVRCLAVTKDGAPHHPRGLPKGVRPQPFAMEKR